MPVPWRKPTLWELGPELGLDLQVPRIDVRENRFAGGAKGDGVTDDTLAIQQAINVASAAGGGIVFCPAGTYLITSTLVMKSRVRLCGVASWNTLGSSSHATVIKVANGANVDAVSFPTTTANARLEDVLLDCNKANQSAGGGVNFAGTNTQAGNRLRGVYVLNAKGVGISIASGASEVKLKDVLVLFSGDDGIQVNAQDCPLDFVLSGWNAGRGIYVQSGGNDTQLHSVDVFWNTLEGLLIEADNVRLSDLQSNSNTREGLVVNNANHLTATGYHGLTNSQAGSGSYPEVRISHSTSGCIGLNFVGGDIQASLANYHVFTNETAPNPHTFLGVSFAGSVTVGNFNKTNYFRAFGCRGIGDCSTASDPALIPLNISAAASQTADLIQVIDSDNVTVRMNLTKDGVLKTAGAMMSAKVADTYSASITPNAARANWHTITATNGTAFTINAPTAPPASTQTESLTIEILNSSGGALGTITWNAVFVLVGGAFTNPANTKKRFITFWWNGSSWIEAYRASADY